jgi:hypothetical protein
MPLKDIFEILAHIATVLGIPVAILIFFNEKRKERRDREYGTYDALDDKYQDYLRLCMDNPELDVYYAPLESMSESSREQKIRQWAMFEILLSLLERAYLMYQDQSSEIKKTQWLGWDRYMHDYAKHEIFRNLWHRMSAEYDSSFVEYMNSVIEKFQDEKPTAPSDGAVPVS